MKMKNFYLLLGLVLSAYCFTSCELDPVREDLNTALSDQKSHLPDLPNLLMAASEECDQPVSGNIDRSHCGSQLVEDLTDMINDGIQASYCKGCQDLDPVFIYRDTICHSLPFMINREGDLRGLLDENYQFTGGGIYRDSIKRHIDEIEDQYPFIRHISGIVGSYTCTYQSVNYIEICYIVEYCQANSGCDQPVVGGIVGRRCGDELTAAIQQMITSGIRNSYCRKCLVTDPDQIQEDVYPITYYYLVGEQGQVIGNDDYYRHQIQYHIDQIEATYPNIYEISGTLANTELTCSRNNFVQIEFLVDYCP